MATLTTNGRAILAQALKQIPFYLGIGTGDAGWDTDSSLASSAETRTQTALRAPVLYRKVVDMRYVVEDENGEFETAKGKYSYSETPTSFLYVCARIAFDDCPDAVIREVGLFANLTLNDDVPEGQYSLTPAQVKDTGTLFFIDNQTTPIYRNAARREIFEIIVAL